MAAVEPLDLGLLILVAQVGLGCATVPENGRHAEEQREARERLALAAPFEQDTEDYERAAKLRDQIKRLRDRTV